LKATLTSAGKEWRSHIEATKKHQAIIAEAFPSSAKQLGRAINEMDSPLLLLSGTDE
jgi:hypothetical protein